MPMERFLGFVGSKWGMVYSCVIAKCWKPKISEAAWKQIHPIGAMLSPSLTMWGERPTRCPAMGNGRPCSKEVCNTGQRTHNYGPKMLLGFKLELDGSTHYLISFMSTQPCFHPFPAPRNCMKWPWSRRFWAGADCQFHGLQAGGLPSFGDSLKRFWWWFSVDSILYKCQMKK